MASPLVLIEFNITEQYSKQIRLEDFSLRASDNTIYWIHCDLKNASLLEEIAAKIHLPDYVTSSFEENEGLPRVVEAGDDLFIQIQCLLEETFSDDSDINFQNLFLFLTDRYCFTASVGELPAITALLQTYAKSIRYAKTPCFILFLLFDNVINDYSSLIQNFELAADKTDLEIHLNEKKAYQAAMDIKKQVLRTKRYLAAIRDILMRISGRKIAVISEQCRLSLDNLFNHAQMVVNEADHARDILNDTLTQVDNALMQKMNKTMKVLTMFAAILLPLSLIAGIYGMNFHWMPELEWKYGYFYALSLMLLCAVVLLFAFKKMKLF
jgi:magnesium transporter